MQFQELPVEIISRICRYVGLTVEESYFGSGKKIYRYDKADFQALRKTCKEIYHKTGYDAAVRYSALLEELEIDLNRQSCTHLLEISKIPSFRDRICSLYMYSKVGGGSEDETSEACQPSEEVIQLLKTVFQNLGHAKCLQQIELWGDAGVDLFLRAMLLAKFHRKLASIPLTPNELDRAGYGILAETPQALVPYIKCIKVSEGQIEKIRDAQILNRKEENTKGLHIKDYRPSTTKFTDLMRTFSELDGLEITGCTSSPRLRFCHGCDDLFTRTFAPLSFPKLSSLTFYSIFVSGGRLRAFIKRHVDTIVNLRISRTTLTDGSWKTVAQGMAKLPHLKELSLAHLTQKHGAQNYTRPAQYLNDSAFHVDQADAVQHFLSVFIEHFATVQYHLPGRFRTSRPIYHEAKLFMLPNGEDPSSFFRKWVEIMRTYAEGAGEA